MPRVRGTRIDIPHQPEAQGSFPPGPPRTHGTAYVYQPRACRTYRAPCGAPQALSALLASAGWWLSNTYLNDAVTGTTEWSAEA